MNDEITERLVNAPNPPTKLFRFTPREEAAMRKAMVEAAKFFKKYGRGSRLMWINLANYYQ